jgi:hypothetical protein
VVAAGVCAASPPAFAHAAAAPRSLLLRYEASGTRHLSLSAAAAAAAAASPEPVSADDVVARVLSCAAANNTETGVLSQLAECATSHANQMSPEQLRNLAVSFAKLGYFNTHFKSVLADAVIAKLEQFPPAVLADTAWAFGEALYYDYDLMSCLHAYLQEHAADFDASGLAKVCGCVSARVFFLWGGGRRCAVSSPQVCVV